MRIFQHFGHQSYGGTANRRGQYCYLQALTQEEKLQVLYIHCLAHILTQLVQDMSEKVGMCRDFLDTMSELINGIMCSPKHLDLFHAFQREISFPLVGGSSELQPPDHVPS